MLQAALMSLPLQLVSKPSPPAGTIVGISIAILIVLFSIQRFGTRWVGYAFSPVILLWFLFNAIIGVYNIAKFDPRVFRAISPSYWFSFFLRNGQGGWKALGGVVLCVTGGGLCCFPLPVQEHACKGERGPDGSSAAAASGAPAGAAFCVHSCCKGQYCITGWRRCCCCCACHQFTWSPSRPNLLLFLETAQICPPLCVRKPGTDRWLQVLRRCMQTWATSA